MPALRARVVFFKPRKKTALVKEVLAWHLENCSLFQIFQFLFRYVSYHTEADAAFSLLIPQKFRNIKGLQALNCLLTGGGRSISIRIILYYVLDDILKRLLLPSSSHESSSESPLLKKHLEQPKRKSIQLNRPIFSIGNSCLSQVIGQHHVLKNSLLLASVPVHDPIRVHSTSWHLSKGHYRGRMHAGPAPHPNLCARQSGISELRVCLSYPGQSHFQNVLQKLFIMSPSSLLVVVQSILNWHWKPIWRKRFALWLRCIVRYRHNEVLLIVAFTLYLFQKESLTNWA